MKKWLSLVISLPTENATLRMRAWRTLKASGAAVLRDGVYLMPQTQSCTSMLESIADDVQKGGGMALVLRIEAHSSEDFVARFNRSDDYAALLSEIAKASDALSVDPVQDVLKQIRKIRKAFTSLVAIDFFPGEAQKQTDAALQHLELATARVHSPDEPQPGIGSISRLHIHDYLGRTWATRCRPWVDRLASAWLIRRFIDPQAHLLWLDSPTDCPPDALGFDFDGATFSHMGARVTFEVLTASFGLEQPALIRMGALVHYLDAGGVRPPEAAGVESVLAGLHSAIAHDDQLLATASVVFDGLLTTFEHNPMLQPSAS